jgi:hypothetical protein
LSKTGTPASSAAMSFWDSHAFHGSLGTKSAATLTMAKGLLFLLQLHQKSLQAGGIFQGVFITLFINS